jgi:putative transcriptional regulator
LSPPPQLAAAAPSRPSRAKTVASRLVGDRVAEPEQATCPAFSQIQAGDLANLSILKTGKARAIRFATFDAICRQLGCQPGDLLKFNTDGAPAKEKLATDAL